MRFRAGNTSNFRGPNFGLEADPDGSLVGLILTLGARGARLVATDRTLEVPSHPVDVVDSTGAGDAFNGALAAALGRGEELEQALRTATAAGALACTVAGTEPSMPTAAAIRELLG